MERDELLIIAGIFVLILIWGVMFLNKPGPDQVTTTTFLIPTTTSETTSTLLPNMTTTVLTTTTSENTTSTSTIPENTTTIPENTTTSTIRNPPYINFSSDECDELNNSYQRDTCYHNTANRDEDASVCEKIESYQRRKICMSSITMKVAVKNNDLSKCDEIPLEVVKEKCKKLIEIQR